MDMKAPRSLIQAGMDRQGNTLTTNTVVTERRPNLAPVVLESLKESIDRGRLSGILGSSRRTPHAESVEAIRDAAATAITFRLMQAGDGPDAWVQSAPPLEAEFLTRVRQTVALGGVRRAIEQAGRMPELHPYALHAALTVELASIARESLRRAGAHGCHVCSECIGFATGSAAAEAELAVSLLTESLGR